MERTCSASLHHFIITLLIGGDEDDLSAKAHPRFFEEFHGIWSSSSLLRVPKDHPIGLDVLADQSRYRRSKGFLLVRAYPNEKPKRRTLEKKKPRVGEEGVPIWTLETSGQRCPDTGSSADADSSFKHSGGMPDTSYCYTNISGWPLLCMRE